MSHVLSLQNIRVSVLDCLCKVDGTDGFYTVEVSNRPGDPQNPVVGSGG